MKLRVPTPRAAPVRTVRVPARPPARQPRRTPAPPRAAADAPRAMPSWDKIYMFLAAPGGKNFSSTPPADVVALVDAGKAVIVDVRPADRSAAATAVGALAVPLYDKPDFSKPSFGTLLKSALLAANGVAPIELRASFVDDVAAAVPAGKMVFLIDETGGTLTPSPQFPAGKASRSLQAAFKLMEAGWDASRVGHVEGGLAGYVLEGFPTTAPFDGKDVGRTPAGGTFIANLPPKRHGLTRWLSGSSRSNSLDSPRERASLSLFDDAATAAATDDDATVIVELPDGAWLNATPRTPVGAPGMLLPPTPMVASTDAAFCVMTGTLSNLNDLLERCSTPPADDDAARAPSIAWDGWAAAAAAGRAPSLAADVLLHCVARTKPDELVALLAELQGPHAFVVYDGARRVVLAARSAVGSAPLWMAESADGGVGFTDAPADAVAAGWRGGPWRELPPGFYVGGRPEPRARQYALTPAELSLREKRARDGGGSVGGLSRTGSLPPDSVRAAPSRSALAAKLASFGRKAGDRLATSL